MSSRLCPATPFQPFIFSLSFISHSASPIIHLLYHHKYHQYTILSFFHHLTHNHPLRMHSQNTPNKFKNYSINQFIRFLINHIMLLTNHRLITLSSFSINHNNLLFNQINPMRFNQSLSITMLPFSINLAMQPQKILFNHIISLFNHITIKQISRNNIQSNLLEEIVA